MLPITPSLCWGDASQRRGRGCKEESPAENRGQRGREWEERLAGEDVDLTPHQTWRVWALSPPAHTPTDPRVRYDITAFPKFTLEERCEGQLYSQLLLPSPTRAELPSPQDLLLSCHSLLSGHTMVKQLQTPGLVYTASAFKIVLWAQSCFVQELFPYNGKLA